MRLNFRFLRRFFEYMSDSAPIRDDVIGYVEGRLKPVKDIDIDESKLFDIKLLEEICRERIIEFSLSKNKNYEKGYCIDLGEKLKRQFEVCWRRDDFRSASEAIRGLMYPRIIKWKRDYDAIAKTLRTEKKDVHTIEGEKNLKEFLEWLKQKHGLGFELALEWHPDANNSDDGKVIEGKIYIYSKTFEEAEYTLAHEYLHHVLHVLFSKDLIDFIKSILISLTTEQKKKLKEMIEDYNGPDYKKRDKFIDELAKNLVADWHMHKQVTSLSIFSGTGVHSQTANPQRGSSPVHPL
jgi:hypothetical protein